MEEVFTRFLKKKYESGIIRGYSQPRGMPLISHLLYADGTVIFTNGAKSSIKALVKVLELYEKWSGQKVSKEKSAIIFSKHIKSARRRDILHITGFGESCLPIKYLG